MSIPVAVPSSSGKTGTFRKLILVDSADSPPHAAAMPAWETPGRVVGSEPVQPPDAPKRKARLFETEPEAPTTLIPFATSTPARHPIYDLANTPVQHLTGKHHNMVPLSLRRHLGRQSEFHVLLAMKMAVCRGAVARF